MKDFKKYFIIPSEREYVFKALTFEPTIELWTGAPATFSVETGSEFSLWDGSIVGKNLEIKENELIRQEWYFGESENPSIVTIKLHEDKKGTSLEVHHTNIPDEDYEDIVDGWKNVYIRDLIEFFV
jgi:activator of HSP90 ATPase